mmetsp:Transcript_2180/g.6488  ORF Transcript_2180/g.6488 Transcript_2180/m.6488 type:complete len:752 (+) Transcript_2180:101-2356(+)
MVTFSLARQNFYRRRRLSNKYQPERLQSLDDGVTSTVPNLGFGIVWASLSFLVPLLAVGISVEFLVIAALGVPIALKWQAQKTSKDKVAHVNPDGNFTLQQRLAYRVDYSFSVVPYVKAVTLMILTAGLILCSGMAIYLASDDTLAESLWEATAGVGLDWTFVGDDDSSSYRVRTIGVLTNIGGLVVTALLLGIVSDAVSMYLDNLRKGSCRVVETNFTLIVGWNNKCISIIEQIAKANISEGGGVVIVLADRPKEEMEVDITANESKIGALKTRVVCRGGSPLLLNDLKKVSINNAKSIIVLADPCATEDQSDIRCIRTLLSIVSAISPEARNGGAGRPLKITVEVCNVENAPLMSSVAPDMIEPVVANGVIGRLLIHAARQPDVSSVWGTLLGFDDCEFYVQHWPQLDGLTFGEVLYRFKDAIPLGVRRKEGGIMVLNPTDDTIIEPGDGILVLAEDDDTYHPETAPLVASEGSSWSYSKSLEKKYKLASALKPQKHLLVGWRQDIIVLMQVLDKLLQKGSELHVLSDMPLQARQSVLQRSLEGENIKCFKNVTLVHHEGDPRSRRDLERLDIASFSSIIISTASLQEQISIEDRDSQTIVSLLLVQDILQAKFVKDVVIVGEIHDPRSKRMILDSQMADALIATNDLISKSLAMVSEDSSVNRVLEDLFSAKGNEVQVVKAALYVEGGERLSFLQLLQRTRSTRSIAIGYHREGGMLVLNPADKLVPLVWGVKDRIVTLTLSEPSSQA